MARVTDIQPQKKHQQLFNIFLDDKFAFSLSDLELSNSGLRIGDDVGEATVEALKTRSQVSKGYTMALRLLARRPRSRYELQTYLERKQLTATSVTEIVHKLEAQGLIDDREFARLWVDNRNLLKPRSRRALQAELMQKRVGKDIIADQLDQIGEETEINNLTTLIEKKKKNPRYADRRILTEYLSRQGFSYQTIQKAFTVLAVRENEPESNAD